MKNIGLFISFLGGCITLNLHATTLISYNSVGEPVVYDADSLSRIHGDTNNIVSPAQDFAFDETGRLFGLNGSGSILEYDPVSLSVLDQKSLIGGRANGLEARNGVLYSYVSTGELVTFSADTLSLTSGTLNNVIDPAQALAFDETGRLFGLNGSGSILEYDPVSLATLNQGAVIGGVSGLVASGVTSVPEPKAILFLVIGAAFITGMRTRHRSQSMTRA